MKRMVRGRAGRIGQLVMVLGLLGSLLAACGRSTPPPPVKLSGLLDALHAGAFHGISFTGITDAQVQASYAKIAGALWQDKTDGAQPVVTAGPATVTGDTATAKLVWSWPFPAGTWRYTAPVSLTLVKPKTGPQHWAVDWKPSLVSGKLTGAGAHLDFATVAPTRTGRILAANGRAIGGPGMTPTMATVLVDAMVARDATQLNGTAGVRVDAVVGQQQTEVFSAASKPGSNVKLTLVPRLQRLADHLLASVGPASALVAIQPSTGKVLAVGNGPGTKGYNYATYGEAPSGSTFKTIDSLALIRNGFTPETTVDCTHAINVDGEIFHNDSEYPGNGWGRIPWKIAVADSCNTAVISTHDKVTSQQLQDAAASLGLGVDYDTGYPAYFGQLPTPASETEKAADMIGQGKVLVSPLTLATVIATVQSGTLRIPTLVQGVTPTRADSSGPAITPITPSQDRMLKTILRQVVLTGTGEGLLDTPGPPVIAKTGTAQFDRNGQVLTHAWMIAAQGDLALAVYVDVGHTGAGVAGPIIEAFLRGAR